MNTDKRGEGHTALMVPNAESSPSACLAYIQRVVLDELPVELHLLAQLEPEAVDDLLGLLGVEVSGGEILLVEGVEHLVEPADGGGLTNEVQAGVQGEDELGGLEQGAGTLRHQRGHPGGDGQQVAPLPQAGAEEASARLLRQRPGRSR